MLKKIVIGVPVLALTWLVLLVISVNIGGSDSPAAEEVAVEEKDALEKYKFANFEEEEAYRISYTSYSDFESFVNGLYKTWNSLKVEDRYAILSAEDHAQVISSVIPESNHWKMNIETYQMNSQFKRLKETAYKLTSPDIELTGEERATLISWFESQLNDIYIDLRNQEF